MFFFIQKISTFFYYSVVLSSKIDAYSEFSWFESHGTDYTTNYFDMVIHHNCIHMRMWRTSDWTILFVWFQIESMQMVLLSTWCPTNYANLFGRRSTDDLRAWLCKYSVHTRFVQTGIEKWWISHELGQSISHYLHSLHLCNTDCSWRIFILYAVTPNRWMKFSLIRPEKGFIVTKIALTWKFARWKTNGRETFFVRLLRIEIIKGK